MNIIVNKKYIGIHETLEISMLVTLTTLFSVERGLPYLLKWVWIAMLTHEDSPHPL